MNQFEPNPDAAETLDGVAIIGMAGRFPGARDLDEFWANLLAGKDTITRFAPEELAASNTSAREQGVDYVRARGVLDDAGCFDAEYFGISPRDAERMDPQHRLFLEACVTALDDGGYGSPDNPGEIGLFAGCSLNTYLLANLMQDRAALDELTGSYQVGEFQVALGNDKDFLTTRVAYKLNLRGPCVSVQSACATSLVAICQASQALLNFQCEMALAGGVSVTFPQHRGHVFSDGGIVSSDGHCRPFDSQATGTVFGHGVGVVLLKRLEDAVRDGDSIAAVIRGFAVNNDGSAKAGYMAPGVDGQTRVILAAQAMAGVGPATITYVEAHGTGTPLGDPIEIAALTAAFRASTEREAYCTVGTAKGNVGHLDSAAGVTGVIKTALQLRHRTLPALAHFKAANPEIGLAHSPFIFSAATQAWSGDGPLRAGVSAFGVGGVNAHLVMEEAPAQISQPSTRSQQVLCVSARSEAAALRAAQNLAAYLEDQIVSQPELELADVAFTLATGRATHAFRIAVAAASAQQAATALRKARPNQVSGSSVAFLLPGQGTQFTGMGQDLYLTEPMYRKEIDACCDLLAPGLGVDLRTLLYADRSDHAAAAQLAQTAIAQPAIFVTEYALATLWMSWGIKPAAMLGHSLGEYVAATLGGVFRRDDALRLIALRGRLMQQQATGAMLSVALSEQEATALLRDGISLAAINAPRACVLSGTFAAIQAVEEQLASSGTATRRLETSHAFHSAMMDPMLDAFRAELKRIPLSAPTLPFVSSVTGTWITTAEAVSPDYWVRQCWQPVRFAQALEHLCSGGYTSLLECGPADVLTRLAQQTVPQPASVTLAASLAQARGPLPASTPYTAIASLWASGVVPDWPRFFAHEQRHRRSLPAYPFERTLHWVEPPSRQPSLATAAFQPQTPEAQPPMTTPTPTLEQPRQTRIEARIAEVLRELSGIETTPAEYEHSFLELGFDSLFLTQATQSLSKAFAVKLTFRMLMEQFASIASLAAHLDATLPPTAFAAPAAQPAAAAIDRALPAPATTGQPIERLFADQLAALSQMFAEQVSTLRAAAGLASTTPVAPLVAPLVAVAAAPAIASSAGTEVRHGSFRPVQPKTHHDLSPQQSQYIADLISAYAAKTPGSKQITQAGRTILADPRAVAGFRPQWKEMVYPLLVERARGSRLWDVDGNEYIDIVNGYGCIMFGHSPAFVVEAATAQLERGVAIGPQTPLAAEVAALICELTGNERVTFCNTGSEAVMAAIRVARTVTGRDKLVYFAGDYHGTFDEVLIRNTPRGSAPVAPGIPLANVTNVVVLDYGTDASLAYLRAHAEEIAAVLVEPVQTRNPALQPADFMRSVRAITEQTGSAMIIDEVVTGFRLAPGGAQQHFGIRADMCTYGKVIGGGHPIGVLSGKREYLDALDGGAWQFGDDSAPEVGVTFFAGTFVRHPLAMAAARAVLRHLRDAGPALQRDLNAKTAALAESLDRFFVERAVPSRIHHFASWFYFTFPHDARLGSLLYYALRAKGIHIQEGYPCFLTTAHSDADIAAIEQAFRETIVEMQQAGILVTDTATDPHTDPHTAVQSLASVDAATPDLDRAPLTEPQQEIFLAAALGDEANCAFNESVTVDLRGRLRVDSLLAALDAVFARHDALRSTISVDGVYNLISAELQLQPAMHDLRGQTQATQDEIVQQHIQIEASTPFDLFSGPLLRCALFQLADDHAKFTLTAHHIVLDGWSANQLLEELGIAYSSGHSALASLPLLPFSRYAVLEEERKRSGDFTDNEAFWVTRFEGRSPRLDLPTDRPRTMQKTYAGDTFFGEIGREQYLSLKKASVAHGCSLYVTLLSSFQLLMHRLSGQDEVVVGISTAGQALHEGVSLVGHCVHFLPMLSVLAEGITTREYLRANKTALLDAYDHQEFTYGSLLRRLKIDREPGRLPLIEVQFNLERVGANVKFDGLTAEIDANPKRFVNTDLFLNVIESDSGLAFTCDYNTSLFDQETIGRWLKCWVEMLRNLTALPDSPVSGLNLLTPAEQMEMVAQWNQTEVDFGPFETFLEVFLRRAESSPDATALVCEGTAWSCARLAASAGAIAQMLSREGVRTGDLVGILVHRSPEMLAAMLGIMMTGAAYVPLDPRHPQDRLQRVLEDAGLHVLLTDRPTRLTTDARIVNLQTLRPAASMRFTPVVLQPSSLAYVIYTSGSTGTPKGVAIEHGALHNLLRSMEREPGLKASDVLVAMTTLAFDIAALELLLPLLTGARLVIATEDEVVDGSLLLALLRRSQATVLQATPGAWRILIDAGWQGEPALKALCGGEALPRDLAETLLDRNAELWNVYGPTETTIWSSATRVERGSGPLRLGQPIANTQFHVLDGSRQIVSTGVTGELFIGGEGLARGYWHRDALTAERFIANPFGPGRLYATGDLARRHADGTIELLGRADFQVKIRGYRIELAEIETALLAHHAVREAIVIAHKPEGGGAARLLAYVTLAEGSLLSDHAELPEALPHALRASLVQSLPDYMIPASFVLLDRMPRTPNGKVDRKALPLEEALAQLNGRSERPWIGASTATEHTLVKIWQEVLEIPKLSVEDSIFELGADSLLIFRIAARAQYAGLAIKASDVFQQRTIAAIAKALDDPAIEVAMPVRTMTRIAAVSRDQYRLAKVRTDA